MNELSLFHEQAAIFHRYNILITYFAYCPDPKYKSIYRYRVYFKDLKNGYVHNPLVKDGEGKTKGYGDFATLSDALKWAIDEVKIYISEK